MAFGWRGGCGDPRRATGGGSSSVGHSGGWKSSALLAMAAVACGSVPLAAAAGAGHGFMVAAERFGPSSARSNRQVDLDECSAVPSNAGATDDGLDEVSPLLVAGCSSAHGRCETVALAAACPMRSNRERIDHNSYSWLRRIVGGWRECGAEFPSR